MLVETYNSIYYQNPLLPTRSVSSASFSYFLRGQSIFVSSYLLMKICNVFCTGLELFTISSILSFVHLFFFFFLFLPLKGSNKHKVNFWQNNSFKLVVTKCIIVWGGEEELAFSEKSAVKQSLILIKLDENL